jgi:hypothetical protein
MIEFSNKIVSVTYTDDAYTMIKVLYDSNGTLCPYHLVVDPNNPAYRALEDEGWTQEKIIVQTAEWKRAQSEAWNIEVNTAAQEIAKEMLGMPALQNEMKQTESKLISLDKEVKAKTGKVDNVYFDHLWDINENKDELFKFKLWALELDMVKNSDKAIKSSIRKATRISQGISILENLI